MVSVNPPRGGFYALDLGNPKWKARIFWMSARLQIISLMTMSCTMTESGNRLDPAQGSKTAPGGATLGRFPI
jgi:hypothetical protein